MTQNHCAIIRCVYVYMYPGLACTMYVPILSMLEHAYAECVLTHVCIPTHTHALLHSHHYAHTVLVLRIHNYCEELHRILYSVYYKEQQKI